MLSPLLFVLFGCFLSNNFVDAKIYRRCELAAELRNFDIPEDEIATWVCIARYESNYDTSVTNPSSGDHGLFQISELYWCSSSDGGYGGCNSACSKFRDDDIADDLRCIRRIYNEHRRISGDGFNAWVVYPLYCKNVSDVFVHDCNLNEETPIHNAQEEEENVIPNAEKEEEDGYDFPPLPQYSRQFMADRINATGERTAKQLLPFTKVSIHEYKWVKLPYSKTSIHHFLPAPRADGPLIASDEPIPQRAPVVLSFPHLLHADQRYHRSVIGLEPNATKHEMFVTLEPISGTPLKVARRVQFNIFMRRIEEIASLQNVTNALVPAFWIEESFVLPKKYLDLIKNKVYGGIKIIDAIKYSTTGSALTIIAICIVLFVHAK